MDRIPTQSDSLSTLEAAVANLIYARLGIAIHTHQVSTLRKAIADACEQFNCDSANYFTLLQKSDDSSPILAHLIKNITIGETYFFRDERQIQLLQQTILPDLINRKRAEQNLSLRIWSAGCASGEEIYTIAMMILELLTDRPAWTLNLLGTDINAILLQKALSGIYSDWSMRSIDEKYQKKYFSKQNDKYVLADTIRDLVTFDYLNLNDDTYPNINTRTNSQDLILCRNVLIYFDNDSAAHVMKKLSASLQEGGFLMLGASDPIQTTDTGLIFNPEKNVFVHSSSKSTPQKTPIQIKPTKLKPIHFVRKKIPTPTQEVSLQSLNKLQEESRWQELLATINDEKITHIAPDTIFRMKAKALANLGELPAALEACQKSLMLDATNKDTYLTLALILSELNRPAEAEVTLRKALFLDHQFVLGHFQLGLLLLKNKQYAVGIKSLKNALIGATNQDNAASVADYPGLTYGQLAEILKKEIHIYDHINDNH